MCALLGVCESVWPQGPLITSPLQSQGGFTDTTGRLWKPHSKVVRCSNTSTTICTSPLMSAPSHSSISGGSGNAGEETSNDINYLSHSWSWIIWGLFLFSRRCYLQRKRLHWEGERCDSGILHGCGEALGCICGKKNKNKCTNVFPSA